MFALIGDVSSPDGAYESARRLGREIVELGRIEYGSKGEAIRIISRDHRLGSFLKKITAGEPATVHLHLYARLCEALERQNAIQRGRVEQNEKILKQLRMGNAAHQGAWADSGGHRTGSLPAR